MNLPVEALTCDLCSSTEKLLGLFQLSLLCPSVHPYKVLCLSCFREVVFCLNKWEYLFKRCSRN